MSLDILNPDQLAKVRDAATRKADWYEARLDPRYDDTTRRLIEGLRHTAADCQAAIDGCEASLRSVQFELDNDGDLARAAFSYIPAMGAAA
jgi:hypothetical protein